MRSLRAVHYMMGTVLDCTLFDIPMETGRALLQQGIGMVRRLERLLSVYDTDSALSQLNRQAGCGPVQVEPELWQLLAQCVALTQRTDGAFDVRVGTLSRGQTSGEPCHGGPSPALYLSAPAVVELAPGVHLDLSGIGKGYAVDQLVALFKHANVPRAFINFGESSLYALGKPPQTPGWPVLVRGLATAEILGVLWCADCALSTSHSHRSTPDPNSSHILDPRTGTPLHHPCLSTIVAPNATLAEALSTAILVSGAAWSDLLARFPETAGLYVGPDGVLHGTASLAHYFQLCPEVR